MRNITRKEKEFLIRNNCDPKDYLFCEELEEAIVFYHVSFKNLWSLKRTYPTDQSKGKSKRNISFISIADKIEKLNNKL